MLASIVRSLAVKLLTITFIILFQSSIAHQLRGQGRDAPIVSEVTMPQSAGSTVDLQEQIDRLSADLNELREEAQQQKKKDTDAFTFKFGGQIAIDSLWFSQTQESRATVGDANDVFDFRRARWYVNGDLWHTWSYVMGMDFAQGSGDNGRPTFLDNYIALNDIEHVGTLRIGNFFEPFTLERSSSNRNTMFMERSLVDMFAPSRNIGIMVHNQNEEQTMWWAVGTFRGNADNFGDGVGDQHGQTIDTRFVWRPFFDAEDPSHYLHLGAAYSFRDAANGTLTYQTRPEASGSEDPVTSSTPFFVNTGTLAADNSQLFGTELLWTSGSFSFQSEAVASPVRLSSGETVNFKGYYANIAYFLTGEYTPYNTEYAITDRVMPIKPVFRRRYQGGPMIVGPGAWQIASRISHVDLDSGSVAGGRLTDATFGLNWFLTPYHRMKFNYILANLNRESIRSQTSIFGLRFDMDF